MKTRVKLLFFLFVAATAFTSINTLIPQSTPEIDQVSTYRVNGQEIQVRIHQDPDGSSLTLDGSGHSLLLNSIDFLEDNDFIKHPIKSITIINAPTSEIRQFEVIDTPITLIDSPDSIITDNQILSFTDSSYTYGIMLDNCSNTEISRNTIFNITSTSNTVSGIHLINSDNTMIEDNTIEKMTSTSTDFIDPRDVYGIRIEDSQEVQIITTEIKDLNSEGNGYGIFLESSVNNKIKYSRIEDISSRSSIGIRAEDSSTTIIRNTSISNIVSSSQVAYGISLETSPYSEINRSYIITIDASLGEVSGVDLDDCTGAYIGNNTIKALSSYGVNYGISLQASASVEIELNDISDLISTNFEAIGIFTEECENLAVNNNSIADISPSYGLYIIKCNETTIQYNEFSELTNIEDWIFIDETSHNVQYSENKVNGQTLMLQVFIRPADLIIEEGNTSSSISWTASDPQAQSYTIFKDDVLKEGGPWTSGSPITHNINYTLSIGQHSYQIVLTESSGNQIIDNIEVSVMEMDLPQLVSSPGELYLSIGASDQVLSWTLTDNYPSNYFIYFNGSEVAFDIWSSAEPITYNVSVLGIEEYTVYNYTLVATDLSGNTMIDTTLVFVFDLEIKTEMPSKIQYEHETTGQVLNLNWTVYSKENGSYSIYQENGTIRTVIDSGVFESGEPIVYQIYIDDLSVGTYLFILAIGQNVENYVTVTVYANPDIPGALEQSNRSRPHQAIPPYLLQPAANPWPGLIFGGLLILTTCIVAYWYVTRQLMVPSAVKEEKKALKKARNVKDIHEEGKRLGAIGRIYFKAGNFKNAIKSHKEALEIFKKTGEKKLQIEELESLGNAYLAEGVEEK